MEATRPLDDHSLKARASFAAICIYPRWSALFGGKRVPHGQIKLIGEIEAGIS